MATRLKNLTEEEKREIRLQKRRERYQENYDIIRERDNRNARRKRRENPGIYNESQRKYREKRRQEEDNHDPSEYLSLDANPDKDRILEVVRREAILKC